MKLSSNLEISPYNRKIKHSETVIGSNIDDIEFKKVRAITQISPNNERSKKISPIHSPTHKKSNLFGLSRTQSFKNSVSFTLFDFLDKGEKEDKQKKKNIIWENFKKNAQYLLIENGTLNIEDVGQEQVLEVFPLFFDIKIFINNS